MSDPVSVTRNGHRTYFKWHRGRRRAADPVFTGRRILEGMALGASVEVDLVIHGGNDVFTSAPQARRFSESLRAVSTQPVVHAELPYAQHAFDVVGSVRTRHTVRAIERFLDVCYCTTKA